MLQNGIKAMGVVYEIPHHLKGVWVCYGVTLDQLELVLRYMSLQIVYRGGWVHYRVVTKQLDGFWSTLSP
jgi:hypothetical protein